MNHAYGVIYCALNTENNKRYIGQTIRGLDVRRKEHINHAKNGSKFAIHQAINKYGEDVFEWSIIDVADNQVELDEKELYWISYYDTYGHGGYNMSVGGQFNKKTNDNSDELSMMFGGKEFFVFDLNGNFITTKYSQTQFAKEIGVGITTINNVLKGLKNSTKSYILIFKDDFNEEKLNSIINRIKEWHNEFFVFDDEENYIGKWDNKLQCSNELNVARNSIIKQLNNRQSSSRIKYRFYYLENVPEHLLLRTK